MNTMRNEALGGPEYKYIRDDGSGLPDFQKLLELSRDPNESEEAMRFLIAFAKSKIEQQERIRQWYSSIE
jgi:hypothetical protein